MKLVCTMKGNSSTHRGGKHQNSLQGGGVHHATEDGLETLCGRDCREWLVMRKAVKEDESQAELCTLCRKKFTLTS